MYQTTISFVSITTSWISTLGHKIAYLLIFSIKHPLVAVSSDTTTCRAWRITAPGNVTANLELVTIPRPTADHLDKNSLLIRVVSSSIYKGDWYPVELGGVSKVLGVSYPKTPGYDYGGHVVAVGRKVTKVKPGDVVFGRMDPMKQGSLGEYIVAPVEGVAVLPQGVSPRQAGTAGTCALAAYQSLAPFVEPGDRVLINGGSGGVGTFGIQIARALGCSVTVTCSTEKIRLCTDLGADDVIDYKRQDVLKALQKRGHVFAHVVDAIGGSPSELYTLCDQIMVPGKKRHFASVGGGINAASAVNMYSGSMRPSWLGGSKTKWTPIIATNVHKDLAQIAVWMGEGKVRAAIDSTFSFEQVPEAFVRHKKGSVAEKILIDVMEGGGEVLPSKEMA
ncbi:hypothetical protein HBI24_189250 [Parastagonospora nodorum]|nr:hypothetical protein HBH46_063170 [Parastagonospora nodorum]KAH4904438.1 hypothetical protein HBI80_101700 [Parastagonospora nodorum]KAH5011436.1 hypothetical protein HBI74_193940 [Parastagonospora nodorum]KAH5152044.1 hypothetical protein HBH69_147270 [Parastagonospora nodorum]KAH5359593.1 hypothetical protein HBI49_135700 [Parastagonospora nodorum]